MKSIMKSKEKAKFALKHPPSVLSHTINALTGLFQNKEQESVKFYKINYLHLKPQILFSKLGEYWKKYRYFGKILELLNVNGASFRNKRILDIGCGYTSVLNLLPDSERYGIDIVINGLKRNRFPLDENINWVNGCGEKLPFAENFFDIVFCSNGIDHYDNPKKALSEIKRVLKSGGIFVLTIDVFNKKIGYRNKQHPHSYTEDTILDELGEFDILLKKTSPINAQFSKYMKGKIVPRGDEKELILVMKLNK